MAKKMVNNSNGGSCWCFGVSRKSIATGLILVGVAYALHYNGTIFGNIILWPWVLIALGICTYLCK